MLCAKAENKIKRRTAKHTESQLRQGEGPPAAYSVVRNNHEVISPGQAQPTMMYPQGNGTRPVR
jgi:hypothetical protein